MLGNLSVMTAYQQFACVSRFDGMTGNHPVRQRIVEILYPHVGGRCGGMVVYIGIEVGF